MPLIDLCSNIKHVWDSAVQVATVQDIAVHPEYRDFGIGKRILGDLTHQIHRQGICEVSVATPVALVDFFQVCGFQSDLEDTTPMWLPVSVKPRSFSVGSTLLKHLKSKL